MPRRKRSKLGKLRDYLFPHRGNRYRPAVFASASVAVIVLLMVAAEVGYLASTHLLFRNTGFLASVLPGAIVSLTNDDRAAAGVAALSEDALLAQAAQLKADDMAAKGYFSHVTPDGKQPWYWLDQVDYPYTYAGENLAVNFTDSKDVEKAWMNSPTHHANLVKPQYTHIGIGVAQGMYEGNETTFVVQFFATRSDDIATAPHDPSVKIATVAKATTVAAPASAAGSEATATPPAAGGAVAAAQAEGASSTVLGAETGMAGQQAAAVGFLSAVATSPAHTLIYVLSALAAAFALLLLVAVLVHLRIQYREVIGGGLALVLVALALVTFTKTSITPVELPADTQSASVYAAFGS